MSTEVCLKTEYGFFYYFEQLMYLEGNYISDSYENKT